MCVSEAKGQALIFRTEQARLGEVYQASLLAANERRFGILELVHCIRIWIYTGIAGWEFIHTQRSLLHGM